MALLLVSHIECTPSGKRDGGVGGGGLKKEMALGARFEKQREGLTFRGQVELNSQRGLTGPILYIGGMGAFF